MLLGFLAAVVDAPALHVNVCGAGDLVEKGEFEKAKQAVYNFFTDLKIKLGNI